MGRQHLVPVQVFDFGGHVACKLANYVVQTWQKHFLLTQELLYDVLYFTHIYCYFICWLMAVQC